jgi:hypothetical protein
MNSKNQKDLQKVVTVFVNSKSFKFAGNAADDEVRLNAIEIDALDDLIEGKDREV